MMLREILRNSRKRKLCSYKFQGSKMTEVENQVWVCLSCKNENNRDVVYFWKTQIYKEIDAEVREKKHGEGQQGGELWVGTQGTLLITGRMEITVVQSLWAPRSGLPLLIFVLIGQSHRSLSVFCSYVFIFTSVPS